ncbi:MAG: hypothetical protein ACTSWD_04735 [Candidatus Heimdallarchaeota archaeon]
MIKKLTRKLARWILKNEIQILESQINILSNISQVKPPKYSRKVNKEKILNALKDISPVVKISDERYSLCAMDDAKAYQKKSKIQFKKYSTEGYDCDEYSFESMGWWNRGNNQFAYGIAWSKTHAFNVFVDMFEDVFIVEPQTGVFMRIEEAKKKQSPDGVNYFPIKWVMI